MYKKIYLLVFLKFVHFVTTKGIANHGDVQVSLRSSFFLRYYL